MSAPPLSSSRRSFLALLGVAALGACTTPQPGDILEQGRVIVRASTTVERLRTEPKLGEKVDWALKRARAVLIVPDLVKGGFLLGAEYGTGILLARDSASGRWSAPAFYSVASGSFGLQVGVQDSEVMFVIMNDGALSAVMNNRFKMGAGASVAFIHVGAGANANTTTNVGADIYAFSKAAGLFGGASLEGSGILPRHSWNTAYYGPGTTPEAIVLERRVDTPAADRLRDALTR